MTTLTHKVFNRHGEYVAATRFAEEAAILVAALGQGSEIRVGHAKRDRVWHEGYESQSAAESYDFVARTVAARRRARVDALHARLNVAPAGERAAKPCMLPDGEPSTRQPQ